MKVEVAVQENKKQPPKNPEACLRPFWISSSIVHLSDIILRKHLKVGIGASCGPFTVNVVGWWVIKRFLPTLPFLIKA